jgi:hypothetical protein
MFKNDSSNYFFLVIFLVAMIGVSKNAYSEDHGWYGAVEFGEANPSKTSFDESMDSLSIYLGKRISDRSSIELGYIDMGEFDFGDLPDTSIEVTGYELSVVGQTPLGESANLFGKLGLFLWESEGVLLGIDIGELDDGSTLMFGGGIDFGFSQSFGGRVSVLQYNDIDDAEIVTLTFGLYANF